MENALIFPIFLITSQIMKPTRGKKILEKEDEVTISAFIRYRLSCRDRSYRLSCREH